MDRKPLSKSLNSPHIGNFLKRLGRPSYLRKYLKITNWYNWLVRFINPISNTCGSLWSLSPFLTGENWKAIDWSQFKRIIRSRAIIFLKIRIYVGNKNFVITHVWESLNVSFLRVNQLCNTRQYEISQEIFSNENIFHLHLALRPSVLFWNNHQQ